MNKNMKVGVKAEWGKPETILMHTPGDEVLYGVFHACAALFEGPFDRFKVAKEHQEYIKTLEGKGAKVIKVVDVLLEGTFNEDGSKKEGKELADLIELADKSLVYNMPSNWSLDKISEQKQYKKETLSKIHPKDLVKIILEKPTVSLKDSKEKNTKFIAESYKVEPVMNMYFLRDQQIVTDKGIVIGKMNSTQRDAETEITKFVFNKLGIKPIYEIKGEGRLEGGDYIPAEGFALIGQGLRTNEEGIKQLLENGAFGFEEIIVVKDPYQDQDQMHLDTYFNILGPKKAIVDKIRRNKKHVDKDGIEKEIRPTVDVYKKNSKGKYECKNKDLDFFEYLEKEKGFEIIDIEDEEQLNYGCNFLCIGPNKIVGVADVSKEYPKKLEKAGVEAKLLNFKNMTKGYGGPHCTTQVLYRVPYKTLDKKFE